jgi:hypothetical protein
MSLPFPINIAAECLRTGCCILGDKKNIIKLAGSGEDIFHKSAEFLD